MSNAKVAGDFLYTRDVNGNVEQGHHVDEGDRITVTDISYLKQLVRCTYPTPSGDREAFVKNACIVYDNDHKLKVPYRVVFDINSGAAIGSVQDEYVTILQDLGSKYNVAYDTDKGPNTKSGVIWKWDLPKPQETTQVNPNLVSDALVNFVKSYEGFVDHNYDDGTGVQTIGYGTTDDDKVALGRCTEEQATEWLKQEINNKASRIKADLDSKGVQLKQNEFDALSSFSYNCGVKALLEDSNLYKRICSGVRDESLRENFTAWCNANGKKLQGLLNRRNEECDMFLNADYIRNL
ncbi:hypothetical protein CSC2_17520 [Clostridium zeae]|uniref:Lysozyme n=1 Tax=Clostridium zeae TaxID=2759022 RepID=A0ABQ1E920_9CLOT|nr:lysozyme [Clostridium zeae]GFZ31226.1 hypothetical protein CSC2_17520 [Clostridium zeae]